MKASLVSATSLIALLVFEGEPARAGVTLSSTAVQNYGDVLVTQPSTAFTDTATETGGGPADTVTWATATSPFSGGGQSSKGASGTTVTSSFTFTPTATGTTTQTVKVSSNGTGAGTATLTLTGTGVAPVQSISVTNSNGAGGGVTGTGNLGAVLVTPAKTYSASAIITVTNIGNGDLASGGGSNTLNNLNGTIGSSGSSVFSGTGGTFNIEDSKATGTPVTSKAYTYNFTPTATGALTATVVTTFTNGATGGTNLANTVTTTLSGTGVAPVAGVSSTASAGYVLVTSSATATVTVSNTGNGNLSGVAHSISNLNGTLGSSGGSGFSGTGTAVSLTDTTSTTYNYVYTPTIVGSSSLAVVSTFSNGTTATNAAGSLTTTLIGTGVAPINSVTSTTAYVRIGTTSTGTDTVSITNIGNGNLAPGSGTTSNLNGTISTALGSGFSTTTTTTTVSLTNAGASTLGFNYSYAPISRSTTSSTVTLSFINGSTAKNNAAQTITATVAAQGVGPTFQSKNGATIDTPVAQAKGATITTGPTLSFYVANNATRTLALTLSNITTDPNGGNASLTNLTIESFTFAGANASDFSTTLTPGTVITEGSSIIMPITVSSGTLTGLLNSTLTIFTDESVGLGGVGDTFTYQLTALIPEPASFAVMGAGLAGLAFVRRRRNKQPTA